VCIGTTHCGIYPATLLVKILNRPEGYFASSAVVKVAKLEGLCHSSQQQLLFNDTATVLPPSPGKTSITAASNSGKQHDIYFHAMISDHHNAAGNLPSVSKARGARELANNVMAAHTQA
jgi:hypothetical protein